MRALKWIAFALVGLFVAASLARPIGQQTIEIATKSGVHVFTVEIVDNDADRAKGLMYRKELPEGQGMLFDFHRDQEVSFWMQNTYIPLDMIFIRGDGRISHIAGTQSPYQRGSSRRTDLSALSWKLLGVQAGNWDCGGRPCCFTNTQCSLKLACPHQTEACIEPRCPAGHSAVW